MNNNFTRKEAQPQHHHKIKGRKCLIKNSYPRRRPNLVVCVRPRTFLPFVRLNIENRTYIPNTRLLTVKCHRRSCHSSSEATTAICSNCKAQQKLTDRARMMDEARKPHQCPFSPCSRSFDRPYKLTQHILLHQNVKRFACPHENCEKRYGSKSHLDRHIAINHDGKKDTTMYKCRSCNKVYITRHGLARHVKKCVVEGTEDVFKCANCNDVFKKKHLLNAHMYQHTGIKAFSCKPCSQNFKTLLEKKRHQKLHGKTYKCDQCFKEFNLWSKYQKHRKSEHANTDSVYICDHCKRKFRKRIYIVRHMKIHVEFVEKWFPCPYENCGRQYSRKSNLKMHIRVTHEKKLLACPECDTKCTTKASLERHRYVMHERGPISPKAPPKTKATGRKERKDIGQSKTPIALRIAGITDTLFKKIQEATEHAKAASAATTSKS